MEFSQLRYFQKVSELQNLTKAAERLYLTQPALSKAISRLEKELGVKLFDREKNRIKLNESGHLFLDYVNSAMNTLNEGIIKTREHAHNMASPVKIASSLPMIMLRINRMCNADSHVKFHYETCSNEAAVAKLKAADVDFAIVTKEFSDKSLNYLPLIREELIILVNASRPLARKRAPRLYELRDESFICMGTGARLQTEEFCTLAGFTPKITFEGNEIVVFDNFLINESGGVAFVPVHRYAVVIFPNLGNSVSALSISEPKCEMAIGLLERAGVLRTDAAAKVYTSIIEFFKVYQNEIDSFLTEKSQVPESE